MFFLPVFAEQIPDYDKPYSPIYTDKPVYSWTDKIKITIVAPSWDSDRHKINSIGNDEDHAIKISTSEHNLEPYRFTETDVNSGIFTAEVILTGFSHDADGDGTIDTNPRTLGTGPTGGFLQVDSDSAVTISFEFADGVILTESVPVKWNLGTIQFSDEIFLSDKSAIITVVDVDLNLNPESIDQIPIEISSDSDSAGIKIEGIETSEDSGKFVATISFTENSSSSGNRLFAVLGDTIIAKYDDHTLPKPYTTSDNLEVQSTAKIDSSIPSVERLQNSEITFSDAFGNPLTNFSVNNTIQIVGKVSNSQNFKQNFVYLIQVKDDSNHVESVSWIQGQLTANQSFDVSQSWTPKKLGQYTIETFVWKSLSEPTPLSSFVATSIPVK